MVSSDVVNEQGINGGILRISALLALCIGAQWRQRHIALGMMAQTIMQATGDQAKRNRHGRRAGAQEKGNESGDRQASGETVNLKHGVCTASLLACGINAGTACRGGAALAASHAAPQRRRIKKSGRHLRRR